MIDASKRIVFVVGLHRSGTSLLFKSLRAHPEISGFSGTGVPEDEGQHLQTQIPTAKSLGGPGMFAFHPDSAMREDHPKANTETAERLWAEWEHHWDLRREVLIEKSPPTLVRSRFFQALFPNSRFVCVTRHPVAVGYATQKWSNTTIQDLIDHWRKAHGIFGEDLDQLTQVHTLKYEDFVTEPETHLHAIHDFIGVERRPLEVQVRRDVNEGYFARWRSHLAKKQASLAKLVEEREEAIREFGYSLEDLDWQGPSCLGRRNQA